MVLLNFLKGEILSRDRTAHPLYEALDMLLLKKYHFKPALIIYADSAHVTYKELAFLMNDFD